MYQKCCGYLECCLPSNNITIEFVPSPPISCKGGPSSEGRGSSEVDAKAHFLYFLGRIPQDRSQDSQGWMSMIVRTEGRSVFCSSNINSLSLSLR